MMWGNWKEKLGRIFSDHASDEQQEKDTEFRNPNVKAKMTYQYPKEKPFRFPVIPDQHTHHKPAQKQSKERPAYERRKSDVKHIQPIRTRKTETASTNKIYKRDPDTPFKPTKVPSPIYGYQPRENRNEIANVPAYKRKRKNTNEPLEENEHIDTETTEGMLQTAAGLTFEEKKETENSHQEQKTSNIILTEPGTKETAVEAPLPNQAVDVKDRSDAQNNEKEFPSAPERKSVKTQYQEEHNSSRGRLKKPERKSRQNQGKGNKDTYRKFSRRKKRDQANQVPFNVMMTPADKKKQLERKRRMKDSFPENKRSRKIPLHLLDDKVAVTNEDHRWIRQQRETLEETLKHFNVGARVVNAVQGPSVTRFEVQPELGVKVSKVKNLSDDIKLNMAAKDIRIEAPIPGKRTIGIEIPNRKAQKVGLQGILETEEFKNSSSLLTIALGLNIEGSPLITNIPKMPHGLIAGATGSGKSVCINTILISLLYKANHEDVKFLLIDPKMVELAPYNGIPHLVSPVITDVKAATQALKWAVREMEERYEKFVEEGVRDIERFNQKVAGQGRQDEKMPFIVIVIDELADLMMVAPQDVEDAISRIAQKARACGIHLLLATQRPSVDVITGLIKANIPTRIAFSVSSQVDSRTILDTSGAEKLLGKGDMLFIENGTGKSIRLQGPFVSDEEIERITGYARTLAEPDYLFEQEALLKEVSVEETEDELLQDAIDFVLNQQSASTSLLQRHYKIGYNRAARLIDTLEEKGIISGQNGSKPREVLVTEAQVED